MIKASALLAALAIGLLVAGVLASSLLMVYVSIGVCVVAALILAVGILTHWSEIFGGGESRPASVPESWSAPQVQVSTPVLASAQASGTQVTGSPAAGTAGREDRRPQHEDAGDRPPAPPVDVGRAPAEVPVAGSGDDLWERVDEELGSVGKRDTGALSWPGIELPVPPEPPGSSGKAAPPETAGPPRRPARRVPPLRASRPGYGDPELAGSQPRPWTPPPGPRLRRPSRAPWPLRRRSPRTWAARSQHPLTKIVRMQIAQDRTPRIRPAPGLLTPGRRPRRLPGRVRTHRPPDQPWTLIRAVRA